MPFLLDKLGGRVVGWSAKAKLAQGELKTQAPAVVILSASEGSKTQKEYQINAFPDHLKADHLFQQQLKN